MKKIMTMLCAAIAACAAFAALTPAQRSYFRNKRICVSRDTTTLPGYVITTWHRNGKPDTKAPAVVTNKLQRIVGREQRNPLQIALEQWKSQSAEYQAKWQAAMADYMSASNRAVRAEARRERIVDWCEAQRDKAMLPTTKALWQSFIDKLEEDE